MRLWTGSPLRVGSGARCWERPDPLAGYHTQRISRPRRVLAVEMILGRYALDGIRSNTPPCHDLQHAMTYKKRGASCPANMPTIGVLSELYEFVRLSRQSA
jgi:hypothetical protein